MSTVNFSVPEEVKQVFNEAFQGQNKSAIIADLMLEAVERARSKQRGIEAYHRILERRKHAPAMTEEEFRAIREAERPRLLSSMPASPSNGSSPSRRMKTMPTLP